MKTEDSTNSLSKACRSHAVDDFNSESDVAKVKGSDDSDDFHNSSNTDDWDKLCDADYSIDGCDAASADYVGITDNSDVFYDTENTDYANEVWCR